MDALVKKRIKHGEYKIVVECKNDKGILIPLKFDIYYSGIKINWRLTWKQIKNFEEAIYKELNYKSEFH